MCKTIYPVQKNQKKHNFSFLNTGVNVHFLYAFTYLKTHQLTKIYNIQGPYQKTEYQEYCLCLLNVRIFSRKKNQ